MHRHDLVEDLKTSAGTTDMEFVLYKPQHSAVQRLNDVAKYNAKVAEVAEKLFSIDGLTPRELMPYPHDPSRSQHWMKFDHMSVQDRLNQLDIPSQDKDLFAAHTNSFGSATPTDIAYTDALRWFALGGYSMPTMYDAAGAFKLGNGGMTNLARHALSQYRGDRVLNKVVSSLNQTSASQVTVSCTDGSSYKASKVICTIPLNCLGDVEFQPPLPPKKRDAIKEGHINVGQKYHFAIDEKQGNWFASTADSSGSDFVFGLKDHNGNKCLPLIDIDQPLNDSRYTIAFATENIRNVLRLQRTTARLYRQRQSHL